MRGQLRHAHGRIVAVVGEPVDERTVGPSSLPRLLPGFIDLHVHGGGGHDTMGGGDAALQMARTHARHGTTSLLATTMTAPPDEVEAALRALAPFVTTRPRGAARLLGVHLEGPYINSGKLGAQPDFATTAKLQEVLALHTLAPLKLITIAPEIPGHLALIVALRNGMLTFGMLYWLLPRIYGTKLYSIKLAIHTFGLEHLVSYFMPFHCIGQDGRNL